MHLFRVKITDSLDSRFMSFVVKHADKNSVDEFRWLLAEKEAD